MLVGRLLMKYLFLFQKVYQNLNNNSFISIHELIISVFELSVTSAYQRVR